MNWFYNIINLGMKSTLLLSLLLVCMVLADNARHRLKKAMKTGITIRKS